MLADSDEVFDAAAPVVLQVQFGQVFVLQLLVEELQLTGEEAFRLYSKLGAELASLLCKVLGFEVHELEVDVLGLVFH